jgi:hypothetical protein
MACVRHFNYPSQGAFSDVAVIKVFVEIFLEYCVPVTFYETNGNLIVWVRYAEWLLTCPVSGWPSLKKIMKQQQQRRQHIS